MCMSLCGHVRMSVDTHRGDGFEVSGRCELSNVDAGNLIHLDSWFCKSTKAVSALTPEPSHQSLYFGFSKTDSKEYLNHR